MSSVKGAAKEAFDKLKQAVKGVTKTVKKEVHKKGTVSTKRVAGGKPAFSLNKELPWVSKALQTPSKDTPPALPGSFAARYQARTARSSIVPGTTKSAGYWDTMARHDAAATFARTGVNDTSEQINALRNSNEVNWGGSFASQIETPTGNVADKLRAEGELYRSEIGAEPTEERQRESKIIQDIFSGKYSWGVTEDEFEAWQKENMVEKTVYNSQTGKREVELDDNGDPVMVFKKGASLPPIGRDETGAKPDRVKLEKAWRHYNTVSDDMETISAVKQREETLMAGSDVGAADSLFDVARDAAGGKKNLFKGIKDYATDYWIDPIKNGRWGTVLMNQLVNWGENTDIFGVGVRAMLSENDYVYGGEKRFEDQKAWVSSIGKEKQKELMELGAEKALAWNFDQQPDHYKDYIINAIKDAGLYDEFLILKKEYADREKDADYSGAFKDAYTTKNNYNADTGSFLGDMAVETVLDPTVLLGGFAKSGSKTGIQAAVKGGIRAGLKAVGKNADDIIKLAGKADKLTNRYVNTIGKHIFSANFDVVEKDISALTRGLIKNKALTEEEARVFNSAVSKAVKDRIDSKTFKIVKSMYYTNKALDVTDSILLKTSFAAPYLAYKLPTSAYKGVRKVLAKTDVAEKFAYKKAQAAARVFKDMIDAEGNTSVGNLDEVMNRLGKEYVSSGDSEFVEDVFAQFEKQSKRDAAEIEKLIYSIQADEVPVDELDNKINEFIRSVTNDKCVTKREFISYMEEEYSKYAERFKGSMDSIYSVYRTQMDRLDEAVTLAEQRKKKDIIKSVLDTKTIDDLDNIRQTNTRFLNDADIQKSLLLKRQALENPSEALSRVEHEIDEILYKDILYKDGDKLPVFHSKFDTLEWNYILSLRKRDSVDLEELWDFSEKYLPKSLRSKEVDRLIDLHERLLKLKKGTANNAQIQQYLDDFERTYEYRHGDTFAKTASVIDHSSDIKRPYDSSALALKDRVDKKLDDKLQSFKEELGSYIDQSEGNIGVELIQYLTEHSRFKIDLYELRDLINKTLDELHYKQVAEELHSRFRKSDKIKVPAFTNADAIIETQLKSIKMTLVEEHYSVLLGKDDQLLKVHNDIFMVFDHYMSSDALRKTMDTISDPSNPLGEIFAESENAKVAIDSEVSALAVYADRIKKQVDLLNEYWALRAKLDPKNSGLSEEQMYALIDKAFGITLGKPERYAAGRDVDQFINQVELSLNSWYGENRVSLDGFRKAAFDFQSDIYEDYADEIKDVAIQARLHNVLSGGHLDSRDDVRVQILQTILRDKGSIRYFNELSERQPVIFADIETHGLNKDLHQISSIAYKEWQPLPENASLSEILDFIEGDINYRQSFLPEDVLDMTISDEVLEATFKNSPEVIKTRDEMLKVYKDKFGATKHGSVVTEQEILSDFMYGLDTLYLKYKNATPVIMTHNNTGFDMKTISARVGKYEEFPAHIVHLQDLIDNSGNTFVRLKNLENDALTFTAKQRQFIRDVFLPVFQKLSRSGSKVKFFDPNYFEASFEGLHSLISFRKRKLVSYRNGLEGMQVTPKPEIKIDQCVLNEATEDTLNTIEDMLKDLSKEVNAENRVFKNNFIFKPDFSEGDEIDNLLKRSMQENPTAKVPVLGYDIVADMGKVKRYFTNPAEWTADKTSVEVFEHMNDFVEDVEDTINYRLKGNTVLADYFEDCKSLITEVVHYAMHHFGDTPTHEYHYLCFLEVPETVNEAYAVARKLYDDILKWDDRRLYNNLVDEEGHLKPFKNLYEKAQSGVRYYNNKKDTALSLEVEASITALVHNKLKPLLAGRYDGVIYKNVANKYVDKLKTPLVEKAFDLKAERSKATSVLNKLHSFKNIVEDVGIENVKDFRIRETYEEFLELINRMETSWTPEEALAFEYWAKQVVSKRRKVMTAQVLQNITKSEKSLMEHLLFHNQLLVVPRKGSALHKKQVNDLLNMLSDGTEYIEYLEQNGYIFVSLKKDTKLYIKNDTRYTDEAVTMTVEGSEEVYHAPVYDNISWFSKDVDIPENVKDVVQRVVELNEKIDVLTDGASRGSTGVLHNLGRQKKLYKSLPESFVKNILSDEYTCDARLWHRGSFDMSILGDSQHCWKLDDTDDTDVLYTLSKSLEEAAGKATAERSYLEHFFGKNAASRMSNLLSELSPEEKVAFLKNNPDQVVVSVFANEKTASGFEVKALKVNDEYGVKAAEASNAIVVPYDIYVDMVGTLNNSTISNTALKLWTKALALTKVGHLANIGTWVRNYMDATIKATGNSGSLTSTLSGQVKAVQLYTNYNKIVKFVDKARGITYKSDKDIERMFRQGIIQAGAGVDMTYEQFHWMEGLMRESVMGGESAITKSILQVTQISGNRNVALKAGRTDTYAGRKATKEAYDLIASDLEKFTNLEVSEVKGLCDDLPYDVFMENGFTRESFLETFEKLKAGVDDMSDETYQHFAEVQNKIIKERGDRLVGIDRGANRMLDKLCNGMLHPMTYIEQIIRLGEYITLEEQGYARSEIFKKITDSQFDYSLKSNSTKVWEMLIPYYNFDTLNLVYWCKQVSENPRMLRYLEHIWGTLSWDAAFELYDDEDTPDKNMSVQYMALNGGIPVGDNGMYFKANPSFLSALNWFYGGPNNYLSKLATPLQYLTRHGMDAMGADAWHIFDDIDTDFSDEPVWEQALSSTPIVGTMYNRYYKHFFAKDITIDLGAPYAKDQIKIVNKVWKRIDEGHTFQEALVFAMPTVFGAVKRYQEGDRDGFELFQMQLKAQGKWYDANRGKVVSLDEYNEEGLNSPSMAWDQLCTYRARYHNEFWDSNKNKFVPANEFTVGGLNRKFDFEKNPEDWDEYCRLRKLCRNEEWDNNQRKFVTPDRYIEGKLNAKGLTPEEVFYYNELFFGTKMDLNQGVLVKYEDYIAGGLNSDNLTWNELCAYKYALHGEKWEKGKGWVKVREPIIEFSIPETDDTSTTKVRRDGNILDTLGLVDTAYAGNASNAQKNKNGKYTLSTDVVKNADIFAAILSQYGGVGQSGRNYYYGNAGGYRHRSYHKYSGWHRYPKRPKNANGVGLNEHFSNARSSGQGIRAGGKTYSKPYSFNDGLAGLRMAASGYHAYDEYYKQEYEYNYKYRNPIKDVADYPQTKLGIQRYLRGRSENLERRFRNRLGSNALYQNNNQRLSTKENLNNMKLSWWNRY